MILDLGKPARLTVHSAVKAVTTFPLDQRQADGYRRQRQSCDGGAAAIKSTMMGYEVVRQQRQPCRPNIPNSFPDVEMWLAPALACIRLEETMKEDGKVRLVRQAENIRLGDPDPSLFAVPAEYTELSPMQVEARFKEWFPDLYRPEEPCQGEMCQHARLQREMQLRGENNYWAAQGKKQTAPPTR